ncbi:MAG TPA: sodium:solute symporter [Ktedonobacteraceae bacterium]|nr:sodium:solute symporter [Ktedonobacteraceae bacterium]
MINWQMFSVFIVVFAVVTVLGLLASRWRRGDLNRLQEWGLAGRRFGTTMSWFLLGGEIYTAYTFIALPGNIFAQGAVGFFSIPYVILCYPIFFMVLPKLWTVARHRGYVTPADFVRERFGSSSLALMVALTGILATMPYIALQMYGIQIVIAQMGVPLDINIMGVRFDITLFIAFAIMALYTYNSGLRAPAMMAMIKDLMLWFIILVAVIYIPFKLGGFGHIFAAVPSQKLLLLPKQYPSYATLAIGSAMALFLYPHTITGILSTNSRKAIQRNAAFLPAYSLLLGLVALLGYMAIAAGIHASPIYKTNATLPFLFASIFPDWFVGFSMAAIAIGAIVPAAIMSIATANLFTRNIYKEYFRPSCTDREETNVAKLTSLGVKIGALVCVLVLPTTQVINFQLLGGLWILQTLPAVFIGLYTNWFHPRALMVGWACGMIVGTIMAASQNFASVFPLAIGGYTVPVYAGLAAMLFNVLVTVALTGLFRLFNVPTKQDVTSKADYEATPVLAVSPLMRRFMPSPEVLPVQPQMQPQFQPQFQSGSGFRAMDPSMFSHERQPPVSTSSPQLPPPPSVIGLPTDGYRPTKRF